MTDGYPCGFCGLTISNVIGYSRINIPDMYIFNVHGNYNHCCNIWDKSEAEEEQTEKRLALTSVLTHKTFLLSLMD